MDDLDKWAAEQCGMHILDGIWCNKKDDGILPLGDNWTLDDARCREIVRERFKILTDYVENEWGSIPRDLSTFGDVTWRDFYGKGKTIPEAEIVCIKAIKEALSEHSEDTVENQK